MSGTYTIEVYLASVEVIGGGIGADWLLGVSAGGGSLSLSRKIGAGSAASINQLVSSFRKRGSRPIVIPVELDIEENDPTHQDYGGGAGRLVVPLTPGNHYGVAMGSVQAVGPDAPASAKLVFHFRIRVTLGAAPRVRGKTAAPAAAALSSEELEALRKAALEKLRARKRELMDDWWHKYGGGNFGFGNWDEIIAVTLEIKELEGTLDEFRDLVGRTTGSWQYAAAEVITELSGVGSVSRVVAGKDIVTGEDVSPRDRLSEALIGVAGFSLLKSAARPYALSPKAKSSKSVIVKRKGAPPEIIDDIVDRLKARKTALDEIDEIYKLPPKNGQRPSAKEVLDRYKDSAGARDLQSHISVEIDVENDVATIYRVVSPPDGLADLSKGFKQQVKYSEHKELLHAAFRQSPGNPKRLYAGLHHPDWTVAPSPGGKKLKQQ